MQIDQKTLKKIISLDDRQLAHLVTRIADEAGINPADLGLSTDNLASLRSALGNATDADLDRLNEIYQSCRKGRSPRGKE